MKLYSRGQLALYVVISALGSAALALGVAAFSGRLGARPAASGSGFAPSAAVQGTGSVAAAESGGTGPLSAQDAFALEAQADSSPYSQDEAHNIAVYEANNDAVVNITTEVMGLNYFMEPVPQDGGSGSGSIIDARGYILTNHHVIENAYKIYISFADGTRLEGRVQGSDKENDIALISFDPPRGKALKTIPFGDSSKLKVGQKVLAIGNPFGLDRTLTDGIVSALGRPVKTNTTIIRDMIQTDAAINPGNSGGPLLNSKGEMIGINTMIYSQSGGSVGIGFAVPVNTAKRVVAELIKYGTVRRGWIDVTPIQLFPQLVNYMKKNGYPVGVENGLLVSKVKKGSNAERAGLRGGSDAVSYYRSVFNIGGDVIVGVDGLPVSSYADFLSALEDNKPGEKVKLEYYRGNKKSSVEIVLSDRSETIETE
jgi:S1-C subfamily serine protease